MIVRSRSVPSFRFFEVELRIEKQALSGAKTKKVGPVGSLS